MRQVSTKAVRNELIQLYAFLEDANRSSTLQSNENNNDNENDDDNSNNHDNNDDINNFQEGSLLNVEFNDATRKACATYLDLLANTALSFIQSEVRCCD